MPTDQTADPQARQPILQKVWDPFVRIFHWTLIATFAVAYVTEDEAMALHVWAGYLVGGLLLARIVWGFVGPQYARFSSFVFGPFRAWRYLIDLIMFRARRHVGGVVLASILHRENLIRAMFTGRKRPE